MTNEFAIKVLTELRGYGDKFANIGFDRKEALDLAIKALEQTELNPSYNGVKTELEDCISREETIEWLKKVTVTDGITFKTGFEQILYDIEQMPSVTPQQKATGSWVEKQVVDNEEVEIEQWQSARCSKCDKYHTTPYSYYFDDYNYCPNCGAKMEVDNEK